MGPFDMMLRDLRELHVLSVIVVALPVASAVLLAMGRRLAAVPLLIAAGSGVVWFLYYARDWPNPGIEGAWWAMLAVLAGWVTVGFAEIWYRSHGKSESEQPDASAGADNAHRS